MPPHDPDRSPAGNAMGWTFDTFLVFLEERDRRYAEVAAGKEQAFRVEKEANERALVIARDIQTYKDQQANELREQIAQERGLYVTHGSLAGAVDKIEATLKPVLEYVASQQGRRGGVQWLWAALVGLVLLALNVYSTLAD